MFIENSVQKFGQDLVPNLVHKFDTQIFQTFLSITRLMFKNWSKTCSKNLSIILFLLWSKILPKFSHKIWSKFFSSGIWSKIWSNNFVKKWLENSAHKFYLEFGHKLWCKNFVWNFVQHCGPTIWSKIWLNNWSKIWSKPWFNNLITYLVWLSMIMFSSA